MLQYVSLLTQTGAVIPTSNVGINTFTAAPDITRTERGRYKIQFNIDLSVTNTVILIQHTIGGYPSSGSAFVEDGCVMIYMDNEDSDNIMSLDIRWFGV